jgi:aspartyl/asparaginyl-tRNA synthetase
MAVKFHYNEVLEVIHHLFRHIFEGLESRYARELAVIRAQYPSQPVQFTDKPLVVHWADAMAMLKEAGNEVGSAIKYCHSNLSIVIFHTFFSPCPCLCCCLFSLSSCLKVFK